MRIADSLELASKSASNSNEPLNSYYWLWCDRRPAYHLWAGDPAWRWTALPCFCPCLLPL
jgi:hypothetical protein